MDFVNSGSSSTLTKRLSVSDSDVSNQKVETHVSLQALRELARLIASQQDTLKILAEDGEELEAQQLSITQQLMSGALSTAMEFQLKTQLKQSMENLTDVTRRLNLLSDCMENTYQILLNIGTQILKGHKNYVKTTKNGQFIQDNVVTNGGQEVIQTDQHEINTKILSDISQVSANSEEIKNMENKLYYKVITVNYDQASNAEEITNGNQVVSVDNDNVVKDGEASKVKEITSDNQFTSEDMVKAEKVLNIGSCELAANENVLSAGSEDRITNSIPTTTADAEEDGEVPNIPEKLLMMTI